MADNINNIELTYQQKVLILKLFKNGVYKDNKNVDALITELCSRWSIDKNDI